MQRELRISFIEVKQYCYDIQETYVLPTLWQHFGEESHGYDDDQVSTNLWLYSVLAPLNKTAGLGLKQVCAASKSSNLVDLFPKLLQFLRCVRDGTVSANEGVLHDDLNQQN